MMEALIGIIINICLVVIGWFLLISNARKIAKRNESNQVTHVILNTVNSHEQETLSQWMNESTALPAQVWTSYCGAQRTKIDDLLNQLEHVNPAVNYLELRSNMRDIRKASTLDIERSASLSKADRSKKLHDTSKAFSQFRQNLIKNHCDL